MIGTDPSNPDTQEVNFLAILTYSIIGLSFIGTSGLGNILVNGSNLDPFPPAIITTGTFIIVESLKLILRSLLVM